MPAAGTERDSIGAIRQGYGIVAFSAGGSLPYLSWK